VKRNKVNPFAFVVRAGQLAWQAYQERRLGLSPRRWLIDLRHLRGAMASEPPGTRRPKMATAAEIEERRSAIVQEAQAELSDFLEKGLPFTLQPQTDPLASVILVLFNRAELTLRCLRSIAGCSIPMEVVLVDNA